MNKSKLAIAIAAAVGATAAHADVWFLTDMTTFSSNGSSQATLGGNQQFTSDAGNNLSSDGLATATFSVGPNPLFTYEFGPAWQIPATGTSSGPFQCIEGTFGAVVGASICGNYNFGTNYANESTVNPDGSNRVIGGDDNALGPAQSAASFDNYLVLAGDFASREVTVGNSQPPEGNQMTFERPGEAIDDAESAQQDSTGNVFDIGANDLWWPGDVTVIEETGASDGGTFTINGSGGPASAVTVTYEPAAAFNGTETWSYRVTDADTASGPLQGQSAVATVTVTVSNAGANDDSGDTASLTTPITIPTGQNDFGFTDPSTVQVTTPATAGTTTVNGSGGPTQDITITYESTAPLYTATFQDTFIYTVTDDNSVQDTATVTVNVNNVIPVANDIADVTIDTRGVAPADATTVIDVSAAGVPGNVPGDAPATVTTGTANDVTATVTGTDITLRAVALTSPGDAISYTYTDVDTEEATGTISVSIPDVAPAVANTSETLSFPGPATIVVPVTALGNGPAADHTATVTGAQFGTVGAVIFKPATSEVEFEYTPNGFAGPDNVSVNVIDADGSIGSGTTAITMTGDAVTHPPQDSLPGSSSALSPLSIGALLLGLPWLRRLRRRR